ncbi:MAG TPA: redoxin domain-containing protein [Ktedonobacteraceae bacterium]|nr:redoxin domain-containing protein [Ktedonobacteraceae bacterium]
MGISILFIVVELVLIVLALLAIARTGYLRLSSSIGIARDGFPPGKSAPSWSLPDLDGHLRVVPARDHWQLLIFANQSLEAFPELIDGMHYLSRHEQDLEVLVISRDSREDCRNLVQEQRLQVPIVPVDPAFYDRYRVRVMPFVFFLDPDGIVRWVGLVGAEEPLIHAWRMAQVPLRSGEASEVK